MLQESEWEKNAAGDRSDGTGPPLQLTENKVPVFVISANQAHASERSISASRKSIACASSFVVNQGLCY